MAEDINASPTRADSLLLLPPCWTMKHTSAFCLLGSIRFKKTPVAPGINHKREAEVRGTAVHSHQKNEKWPSPEWAVQGGSIPQAPDTSKWVIRSCGWVYFPWQ